MRGALRALAVRLHRFRAVGALIGASRVKESARFFRNEVRNSRSVARYRLRDSGRLVHVRHPLLDVWVIEEVFAFRVYELPERAERLLRELSRPVRVLDLGGHIGSFGLYALSRFPDASLVSFEPDPQNVEQLRATVRANRLEDRWQVVEACAATGPGSVGFESSFHLSRVVRPGSAAAGPHERAAEALPYLEGTALLEPVEVRVECRDAFPYMAEADLLKIDIEGGEWDLLDDPRFAEVSARVLVMEYHPEYAPGGDGDAILRRALADAGYELGPTAGDGSAGLLWAYKAHGPGP
jgi:FkbM family methyltransferase